MNKLEMMRTLEGNLPRKGFQRTVLMLLALNCREDCSITVFYADMAADLEIAEPKIRQVCRELVASGFLRNLPNGDFEVLARASRKATDTHTHFTSEVEHEPSTGLQTIVQGNRDSTSDCPTDSARARSERYRGHTTSWSEPSGVGARQSLGAEDCPDCGGTGWMEVRPPSKMEQLVVDVCVCRGGKYREMPKTEREQYLSARQKAGNEDGVKEVRKWLERLDMTMEKDGGENSD